MSIPGSGSPLLLATTTAAADAGYVIPKSLRFNPTDTASLSRTPSTAGNRRTWTVSLWLKRTKLGTNNQHVLETASSPEYSGLWFAQDDSLEFRGFNGSSYTYRLHTSQKFRDPSAWYHIVISFDSTASTSSDRLAMYVNGVKVTDFANTVYPSQNHESNWNNTAAHYIGTFVGSSNYYGGLIADVQSIDGQALQATDFGETRSSDGVWVPKEYTGFGTNPNDGTTWSDGVTFSGSIIAAATNAFDGNPGTSAAPYDGANGGGTPQWVQVTFSPGIPYTSSVRVERQNGNPTNVTVSMNGGTAINSDFLAYTTVATGSGTLTSIKVQNNGSTNTAGISRIEVDGYVLLDDARDNSFHLNFSDSSTNEALGFDSAPTTPDPDPKKGMDVVTWTGNGTAGTNIGGLGFEPDFVWIKRRNAAYGHVFSDSVRGFGATGWAKQLIGNSTEAENSGAVNTISSFNPDGFTLGTDGGVNLNSSTYVGWCWRAGGPAVANSDGTITSQVSANTDYGFSIVSYTGNNTSGATVGHGLSSAPKWIVVKSRDQSGQFWHVYHASLAANEYIYLNSNAVKTSGNDFMNGTRPTSSVFSLGNGNGCNKSSDPVIAYCWSEVSGFSKFDGFNGDGNSGKKITTGFKPKFVIIKRTDTIENWHIFDSERGGTKSLFPDITNAEVDNSSRSVAFVSDGFTLGTQGGINASGGTYIYAAFADRPGNNWDVNNIVTNEGLTTSKSQFDVVTYTGNGGTQKIGGPVYSAGATATGGFESSNPAANGFNGTLTAGDRANGVTVGGTIEIVFSPGLSVSSTVGIWSGKSGFKYQINDSGSYTSVTNATEQWHDASFSGTLTNLKIQHTASNEAPGFSGIRVDSTTLLDGTQPGLKFQPDFVWIKNRDENINNALYDSVRGNTKVIFSNKTEAEATVGDFTSFNSDGFTVAYANRQETNKNNINYVAWCWKAGGTAVSNTDGSITSSVSANAAYGFSVVNHVGTNAAGTFGHGLNQAPDLMIFKNREATDNWFVWARSADGTATTGGVLNNSNAFFTNGTNELNSTLPTDSVIHVGSNLATNGNNQDVVTYCFHNVPGYQRIGSYIGNGSTTGPVVVTGFKPRFILLRSTSGSRGWLIYDTERDTNSTNDNCLFPHTVGAENSDSSHNIEILDNGFQPKTTSVNRNGSGETYIYLAIGDDEIGSDEDCLVDVPNAVTADADATDTTGGYQRGNYATMNPLHNPSGSSFSNGNLQVSNSGGWYSHTGTIGVASGKWYYEFEKTSGSYTGVGWRNDITTAGNPSFNANGGGIYLSHNGNKQSSAGSVSYGATWGSGDIVGVAFDCDAGTIEYYKNGVSQGVAFTGMTDGTFFPEVQIYQSGGVINFGQMRFKYPMPSGYAALNTTALPAATIADGSVYFQTALWSGSGSARSITTTGMSPDWVWIKERGVAGGHNLYDAVRGATKFLASEDTGAEGTDSSALTSFNSDGFSLGTGFTVKSSNKSGRTYAGWCWDAGSSTVSNTDGSITSSVRANQSAGFSIVSYAGTGSSATVGHGLSAAPHMYIVKNRSNAYEWGVYHIEIGTGAAQNLNYSNNNSVSNTWWNNTAPTNSVFSIGTYAAVNQSSANFIAYCFAPVAGYSAFGSYTGNGSTDGPFIYTGFRPAFLIVKSTTSSSSNWLIADSVRSPENVADEILRANTNGAETDSDYFDLLSNGFKVRGTPSGLNSSGETVIWAAFAENPFQANGGLAR